MTTCGRVVLTLADAGTRMRSITDTSWTWPDAETLLRVLLLRDYNTRVVVIGTALLGVAAGVIGTFAYLRKRAMLGDALSHATLPGIAVAFMLTAQKDLGWLLLGASLSGIVGVLAVLGMRRLPRIQEDAAIGIVLSVFFGAGMVLFSIIQQMKTGEEAGLQGFIYGKAASMVARDARLIAVCAGVVILGCLVGYKEFRIVCFDPAFAAALRRPVLLIDLVMMSLVIVTTVIGLQAVGLILIVALLIIPAAAARFWTEQLSVMTVVAGAFGALSGWLGATLSALMPRLPTGAIIVLAAGALFGVSMFFSPQRGVVAAVWRRRALSRRVAAQNLLRAVAELEEEQESNQEFDFDTVRRRRSWTERQFRGVLRQAARGGMLVPDVLPNVRLTGRGRQDARRLLRNHRLWELYLITYADIAPSHVDRDADELEHILPEGVVRELEATLRLEGSIPVSPHAEGVDR